MRPSRKPAVFVAFLAEGLDSSNDAPLAAAFPAGLVSGEANEVLWRSGLGATSEGFRA